MPAILFEIFPAIVAVSGLAFLALWVSVTFGYKAFWYDIALSVTAMILPVSGFIITANNLNNEWTNSVGYYQVSIVWMGIAISMIIQSFLANRRRWKKK